VTFSIVAPIGFYALGPIVGTVAIQPTLNEGGSDLAAAFPITQDPNDLAPDDSYLIAFVYEFPKFGKRLFYAAFAGSLSPIPVPGAIFLWLTGLAGLALFRRRLASGSPVTATAVQ